jgi:uncharacterized membrane protein
MMKKALLQLFVSSFVILVLITTIAAAADAQEQTQSQNESSLSSSSSSSPRILGQSLENLIRPYVGYITFAIDVAAGIIIGISAIMALISFVKILREPFEQQTHDKETIRLRLARGMLLALDFEVGSDILKTILVPSTTELTILAVVVGIRIVLSWSLSKEIDRHVDAKTRQSTEGKRKLAFQTTSDESGSEADINNGPSLDTSSGRAHQRMNQKQDTDRPTSPTSGA